MSSATYTAKPIANARDAIASHIRWKIALHTAARMREPLSERATRSIQHPEQCAIRLWLLSEQNKALRSAPSYAAALDCHADFHREMQRIASLLNTGQYAEATHLLSAQSLFERKSLAMATALMALDRAAAPQRNSPPLAS